MFHADWQWIVLNTCDSCKIQIQMPEGESFSLGPLHKRVLYRWKYRICNVVFSIFSIMKEWFGLKERHHSIWPMSIAYYSNQLKWMLISGRPDQVHNCTITNISMTSLGIRCLEGFNGGLTQSFMLEVRDMSTQVSWMFSMHIWIGQKMALTQIESHNIKRI